jgi:hypothetical protein
LAERYWEKAENCPGRVVPQQRVGENRQSLRVLYIYFGGTCSPRPRSLPRRPFTPGTPAWNAYALFVAAYRDAAEKLRAGVRNVVFPIGSFPPALPFVDG